MDLSELKTLTAADTEFEGEDSDMESDLSNAISLLEDCSRMLDFISIDPKFPKKMQEQVDELGDEIYEFLNQFEDEADADEETDI